MNQNENARSILCSGCYEILPEPQIHVIPFFNGSVGDFVTTYRCGKCWLGALADTAARLRSAETLLQLAPLAAFFERHSVFVHAFRRGDPAEVVKRSLLQMLELMRTERLKLQIGPASPWPGAGPESPA